MSYICCSALDIQLAISKKITLSTCEPLTYRLKVAGDWLAVTCQAPDDELKTPANLWFLLTLEWKPSVVPKKRGSTSLRAINIQHKTTFVPRMQQQRKAPSLVLELHWKLTSCHEKIELYPAQRQDLTSSYSVESAEVISKKIGKTDFVPWQPSAESCF